MIFLELKDYVLKFKIQMNYVLFEVFVWGFLNYIKF